MPKLILKEINIQFCYKNFEQFRYISPLESETLFNIMRKSLLSVVFLMASLSSVIAQDLFKAPDSVCVNQSIQLISNVPGKQSHYWGFCSGYMYNDATGLNIGDTYGLDGPSGIVYILQALLNLFFWRNLLQNFLQIDSLS